MKEGIIRSHPRDTGMIETAAHTDLQLVLDYAFGNQKLFAGAMDIKMGMFLLSICHKPQKTY